MTTETVPVEIKSWLTGEVIYTAAVDVSIAGVFCMRAAVEIAVKARAYLSRAYLSRANLSGADLSGADLSGAYISRANLSRANLSGADLSGANLSGADLSGADLSGAYLSRANLSRANLSRANLSGADLSRADLSGANLSGANLSGAKIIALICRAIRSDGYEFTAWHTDKGVIIIAGCQRMEGTDAYRQHAKTYASRPNGEALAAETLAILDFIDARTRQVVPAVAVAA